MAERGVIFDHLTTLSDPTRVRILRVLEAEELAVGELARVIQAPQSTVSRHLKRLEGFVQRRNAGTTSLLRVDTEALGGEARQLWELVRAHANHEEQWREDRARLASVVAERSVDSRAFFGRVAAEWERVRQEIFGARFLVPTLLGLLPRGLRVADLGCGTGDVSAILADAGADVIAIDHEPAMLEAARKRLDGLENVTILEGQLEALPLEDGGLDVALALLVLHHVEELGPCFEEAARTLRSGGRLVVLDMIAHDRADYRHRMGHKHLGFSRADLDALAAEVGLAPERYRQLLPDPDAQGPPLFVATWTLP